MKRTPTFILAAAIAVAACSSSSTTEDPFGGDAGGPGTDAGSSSPCGEGGVYGTFHIKGTLNGTENICGLSLGSFDNATLVVAKADGGTTVTVTNSGSGHIDVASCSATVTGCKVSAGCSGSTDQMETVGLTLTVTGSSLSGSSQLGFNGCQAPGLSFTGTR